MGRPLSRASCSSLGIADALLRQRALHPLELVTALEQVHRDADGLALIGDGARHGLAHPPRRVRGEPVAAAPVELLDGADEPELAFLHEIVHVEALADEAARVGHDEAEVRADELVLRARGRVHAADEAAARALVAPAAAGLAGEASEHAALEAGVGQLGRDAQAAAAATLARGLVVRGLRQDGGRAGGALEQLREALGAHLAVGVLVGVAQQLGRHGPTRRARSSASARNGPAAAAVPSSACSASRSPGLDAARKFDLFLVGEDAAARRPDATGWGRRRCRRGAGRGRWPQQRGGRQSLERQAARWSRDPLAVGRGRWCVVSVHEGLGMVGEKLGCRLTAGLGSLGVGGNMPRGPPLPGGVYVKHAKAFRHAQVSLIFQQERVRLYRTRNCGARRPLIPAAPRRDRTVRTLSGVGGG